MAIDAAALASDSLSEFAPAKINLTLHVTGQRADGYHLLDSLVVFADVGDTVSVSASDALSLRLTGPMAAGLPPADDNLVLRAARLMQARAAITLDKRLPLASGIGGGSADAAATLRALARLTGAPLPDPAAVLTLGADVPVCLRGTPLRMQGVGETLDPVPRLPEGWLVLVNPGVAVSTPEVFRALLRRDNAPMPRTLPRLRSLSDLSAFLQMMRNDMEPAATALASVIAKARSALQAQPGCLMARMSGSGATCFGLFPDGLAATAAARAIQRAQAGWWVAAAQMRQS